MVVLLVMALALTALYLNRRLAAREILVGWLDRRGIEADVEVERLELTGFVGKITIGDPQDPQVRVDRVEVDYAVAMPWSSSGMGVTPSRIRLVRPVARASWKDGKLSLGSLDPLIDELTSRPPRPDSRAPLILVERGLAILDTDYGPVRITADARVDNSRLVSLRAELPQTSLKSGNIEAEAISAKLDVVTRGDVATIALTATAARLKQQTLTTRDTQVSLTGTLPYPDTATRQSRGPIALTGQVKSATLASGDTLAQQVQMNLKMDGQLRGWIDTFTLTGQAAASGTAETVRVGNTRVRAVSFDSRDTQIAASKEGEGGLLWRLDGPAQLELGDLLTGETRLGATRLSARQLSMGGKGQVFEIEGPVALASDRIRSGDFDLRKAQGQMRLDVVRDSVTRMSLTGGLTVAQGAFAGLGPVKADDLDEIAALKQSLGRFGLVAPSLALHSSNAGFELNLLRPVEVRPSNGGLLTLEPGKTPLFAVQAKRAAGGSVKLTSVAGGGLPAAEIDVPQWHQITGGLEAEMNGKASMDIGPAKGLTLRARGLLTTAGGTTRFTAEDCVPVSLTQLNLGENDLMDVSGNLCPTDGPMLTLNQGTTQVRAQLDSVHAKAPSVAVDLRDGSGLLVLDSRRSGLGLTTQVERLSLNDTSGLGRFMPLEAKGKVVLAADTWQGTLDLMHRDAALGQVLLHHDGRSGSGRLDVQTPALVFSQNGLRPAALSPMAAEFIQSPVEGSAQFNGQLTWSGETSTSSGQLVVPGLDFVSPAGKIEGLKGNIVFTSLIPLITAPDQRLQIDRLDTVVPLTDLDVQFALRDNWLMLAGGVIKAAGGSITIEPFDIPLQADTPWGGVVLIHQVQLNELLKTANLQEKAELDSVVSGRLPFVFTPDEGWKIRNGQLASVRPGRLSIAPEVFDELGAAGGQASSELPPNTMQDLAYQAMQDLAISDLTADVNSLENGRLGVRFRIHGRHDPPQREQLRLTLIDLIRRDFLKKKLNLPSDTPIDLTLDTTWNANQIASDLMDYIRRGETP